MNQAARQPAPTKGLNALTDLRGVGPALAEKLGRLGVYHPEDLLFILPLRYEDRTRITPIGSLTLGQRAVVEAEVELTEVAYRGRRVMLCRVSDGTAALTLRFFYFSRAQQAGLARGKRVRFYGEVRRGAAGFEMVHPEYRILNEANAKLDEHLTPVYPSTEGVQQGRLRNLINQVLDHGQAIFDYLPADLIDEHKLPTLINAVTYLHRPPKNAQLEQLTAGNHPAQQRLAMEEILAHHLSLRQIRQRAERLKAEAMPATTDGLSAKFISGLPFNLTGDQRKSLDVIYEDLAQKHPMMRLLQGDVGCGKTVVAAAAALHAVSADCQAAIMAPTELLAEQHRDNLQKWFKPLGVELAWLSGALKGKQRARTYEAIAAGTAQIVVGTHALFQEGLEYKKLGLVIVDEQHRFGVHQRLSFMEKGATGAHRPHQLVMTATPIPRTLAMTMYADLDVSVIREMPPGRQSITTVALPDDRRGDVVSRVRAACEEGQRAYWVCPLIEESEALNYQDAQSTYAMLCEALQDKSPGGIAVGLIHGRMKNDAKEAVMKSFAAGDIQVLVATTVIEVGVDVPEATLMIIENSERMGLAQLHQLRGRVGRSSRKSSCVLLYRPPLSQHATERLGVMRETGDGFVIAQKDLELRGPGEVLGKRQTGLMQMRVADLIRDAGLLPQIQELAQKLLRDHPDSSAAIMHRWLGKASEYGNV